MDADAKDVLLLLHRAERRGRKRAAAWQRRMARIRTTAVRGAIVAALTESPSARLSVSSRHGR